MDEEREPTPGWQKSATAGVFVLMVVAFAYITHAYMTQRSFNRLMDELISLDPAVRDKAAEALVADDGSLPYLTNAVVNSRLPEERVLCADLILRMVSARKSAMPVFENKEDELAYLRSGLDLEAVTRVLQDESRQVRAKALTIVDTVGAERNYQKNRREEMLKFEALLDRLEKGTPEEQEEGAEGLREAGIRALNYLVGVVFEKDDAFRLRGLKTLRTMVREVLKGSNQSRIVTLLGRRRCQLLLREMTRLEDHDRSVITDILNVSGRIPAQFFTDFVKEYASVEQTDEAGRRAVLTRRIEELEDMEKVTGAAKIQALHDKTGK